MNKKMLERQNKIKLRTSIFCFFILLILIGCTSFEAGASLTTEEVLIPDSVNGLDRDLWPRFIELINSPDCQLPCWWGFRVGISTEAEVIAFLQENDFTRSHGRYPNSQLLSFRDYFLAEGLGFDFHHSEEIYYEEIRFGFEFDDDGIINSIAFSTGLIQLWLPAEQNPYLLPKLFNEIQEQPTIHVVDPSHVTLGDYPLFIDYPVLGMGIQVEYSFREYPLICLSHENMTDFEMRTNNTPDYFVREENDVIIPIEEGSPLTGITAEDFVQFFREHPNECLDLRDYP